MPAVAGGLVAAIIVATAFNFTNGVHDAADAVATLVATRTATPGPALVVAALFTLLGPLVLGAAVADTVGKVVDVPQDQVVAVIGAGVSGALVWNVFSWWRGLPSSSTHALDRRAGRCRDRRRRASTRSAGAPSGSWSCRAGALARARLRHRVRRRPRVSRCALRRATPRGRAADPCGGSGSARRCSRSVTVRTTRPRRRA